ncbi:MAG: PKD domain-containing protein [Schleiferiaceae bacterium]
MRSFLPLALAIGLSLPLAAQCTPNTALNTPVATGATDDLQAITGLSGRTYVVMFQPNSGGYSPRLQVLNEQGVPRLGNNGMVFNTTTPMSTYTVTWDLRLDAQEHVYIGFTGTGNTDAVVHRLDSAGNHVWSTSGVALGQGYDVKLLPLANGDVMAGWLDANGGGAKLRKIGAAGSFAWPAAVTIASPTGSGQVQVGELMEYSNGDVLVIFYVRTGFGPSALPYAQRYSASGTAVWLQPKALTSGWYVYSNRRFPLVQRGDTAYFGMAAAQGLDLQAKVQRINPLGGLPWGTNGIDVSTLNNQYERNVTMGVAPDGDMLYVAAEVTPTSQGQMGTILQKMHVKTGALPWGAAGRMLFNPSNKDQSPQGDMGFIASKPVILYSDGFNNGGTPVRLLAAFLDTAGALTDSIPMATYTSPKGRVHLSGAVNFDVTAVWAEDRGAGTLAFAQRLNRTPCPPVSAGMGWGSALDSSWLWYAGGGADSLYWTLGDGTTASSNASDTLHHRYSANGTYTVWQFAYRNCGSVDSTSTNVVIQGIGLTEGSQPISCVVPTRSVGPLVLQAAAPMDAVCWDALGRRVASVREWVPNTVWNPFTTCPNGVYYIELADGQRWPVVLQRD